MNGDLIYRSALLEDIEETVVFSVKNGQPSAEIRGANKITDRIKAAPAVDAVEVVRCRDCAWCREPFSEHFPQKLECMRFDMEVAADEFCSRSERRTEE